MVKKIAHSKKPKDPENVEIEDSEDGKNDEKTERTKLTNLMYSNDNEIHLSDLEDEDQKRELLDLEL